MSFLFLFSKYISVPILSEWLLLKDLIFLERSISNLKDTQLLRLLLAEFANLFSATVVSYDKTLHVSVQLFRWLQSHKLRKSLTCITDRDLNEIIFPNNIEIDYLTSATNLVIYDDIDDNNFEYLINVEVLRLCNNYDLIIPSWENLTTAGLNYSYSVNDNHVVQLCRNCPQVTALKINATESLSRVALYSILIHGRKLESLEVHAVTHAELMFHCSPALNCLTANNFTLGKDLAYYGRKLTRLSCSVEELTLEDAILFPTFSPKLSHLCLKDISRTDYLSRLLLGYSHLTSLHLVDELFASGLNDIASFAPVCSQLSVLTLDLDWEMLDGAFTSMVNRLTDKMINLSLPNCGLVNDNLIHIATTCTRLTILNINGNYLDDSGFLSLAKHCHQLIELHAASNLISDIGLFELSNKCKRLDLLNLNLCNLITDVGILFVLKWSSVSCVQFDSCENVSDELVVIGDQYNVAFMKKMILKMD